MKQSHKDAISLGMIKYWDRRHRKEARETYFVSPYDFAPKAVKVIQPIAPNRRPYENVIRMFNSDGTVSVYVEYL